MDIAFAWNARNFLVRYYDVCVCEREKGKIVIADAVDTEGASNIRSSLQGAGKLGSND